MAEPPDVRLFRVLDRLDELTENALQPWLDVGLDPEGGAFGYLDRFFQPRFHDGGPALGPSGERLGDQSLVQQSRHLFTYSFVHDRRGPDRKLAEFAHRLYVYLLLGFSRDAEYPPALRAPESAQDLAEAVSIARGIGVKGPLLHLVPRGGQAKSSGVKEPENAKDPAASGCDDTVQLYAQAFAILGLSTYSLAFDVPEAARQALALFRLLDDRHDPSLGGYTQTDDGGWLSFVGAPGRADKCANTHLHLMEAVTALCLCFPEKQLIKERLWELVRFMVERFFRPPGFVHRYLYRDCAPAGPREVSFGHDLETSWLLLDALDALRAAGFVDKQGFERVVRISETMALYSLGNGWDPAGGVFESGLVTSEGCQVTNRDKIWWAQAESLPATYYLFQRRGDPSLLTRLEQTLSFLTDRSIDSEGGEFFWGVDSMGRPTKRGLHKGELWKTPYHAVRAFVVTADAIRRLLGRDRS